MKPYYQDSLVTLFNADSREVLSTIESGSIDFIFTDPPYGHNNNNNGDLAHRREEALGHVKRGIVDAGEARPIANDGPEANGLVRWFYGEAFRLLGKGCCCCCCCGGGGPDPQFARWSLWLDEAIGFKHAVVWDKGGLGMGWHYRRNYEMVLVAQKPGAACRWYGGNDVPNVLRVSGIKPGKNDHPTPKPVAVPSFFIQLHTKPGDLILEPFCGGGSTAVAAKILGRRCVAVELDERWCELTATRLQQEALPLFQDPTPKQETQSLALA